MLKVGLIGCGAIGTILAKAIDSGKAGRAELVAIYDARGESASALERKLKSKCCVSSTFAELLESDADLVVEAASQQAVREYGEKILREGKSLVVMSVGALLDEGLLARLEKAAKGSGAKIHVPTGAVLAIDAVKAASIGGITSVELTTSKPPHALGIEASRKKVIFRGSAEEAVRRFPQNINVAATLSLAGIGKKRTKVVIIADPKLRKNVHELKVRAKSGDFRATIENLPSPENPKTSYIAALSAIQLLKNLTESVRIGT